MLSVTLVQLPLPLCYSSPLCGYGLQTGGTTATNAVPTQRGWSCVSNLHTSTLDTLTLHRPRVKRIPIMIDRHQRRIRASKRPQSIAAMRLITGSACLRHHLFHPYASIQTSHEAIQCTSADSTEFLLQPQHPVEPLNGIFVDDGQPKKLDKEDVVKLWRTYLSESKPTTRIAAPQSSIREEAKASQSFSGCCFSRAR